MDVQFVPTRTDEQLAHLEDMARQIWQGYWPERIGQAQTDYMLDMFHSLAAMKCDMAQKGYRYWILVDETGAEVGYTAGATEELTGEAEHDAAITHSAEVNKRWPKRFFVSKVYLFPEQRGKHYASRALAFFEQLCIEEGLPAMYLTVNRENELAIRAYEGNGFELVEVVDNDIGEGFTMYDYVMAKEIAPA